MLNALCLCQEALAAPGAAVPMGRRISSVPAVPSVAGKMLRVTFVCECALSSHPVLGKGSGLVPRAPLVGFGTGL